MNSRQRKSREYLTKRGFIKPVDILKQSVYKRTEGNTRFEYGPSVANSFSGWQSVQRDFGRDASFQIFYDGLAEIYQNQITVTILESPGEKNKDLQQVQVATTPNTK